MAYTLMINGESHDVDVDGDMPLLWVVRDHLQFTGTKFGCGLAQCGACTMQIDGVATRTCVLTVASAVGKNITTIEGLASPAGNALQQAWVELQVPQCGYWRAMRTQAMPRSMPPCPAISAGAAPTLASRLASSWRPKI